jgi:hypothetical protein
MGDGGRHVSEETLGILKPSHYSWMVTGPPMPSASCVHPGFDFTEGVLEFDGQCIAFIVLLGLGSSR